MRQNCRAIATEEYTLELQVQQYIQLYRQVLEKQGQTQGLLVLISRWVNIKINPKVQTSYESRVFGNFFILPDSRKLHHIQA
ncbi:MAG: glycosyltransferase [Brasilonema sp.]